MSDSVQLRREQPTRLPCPWDSLRQENCSGLSFPSPTHESEVTQSYPTLSDPMDCSLPCSSVRGILQARILEWMAISFSRSSSQPSDRTQVSCIVGRCFYHLIQCEEELKSLLMKLKVESEKVGLKLNIQKMKIWSHHFMGNRWGNSGNSVRFYFFGLQNHCTW